MSNGFYKIKKSTRSRKFQIVQSSCMANLSRYCKEFYFEDWQRLGMLSRADLAHYKESAEIVG